MIHIGRQRLVDDLQRFALPDQLIGIAAKALFIVFEGLLGLFTFGDVGDKTLQPNQLTRRRIHRAALLPHPFDVPIGRHNPVSHAKGHTLADRSLHPCIQLVPVLWMNQVAVTHALRGCQCIRGVAG